MYIASMAWKKPDALEGKEFKKFGRIWYDADKHSASLFLTGFRHGNFIAKPYENIKDPPFLSGDVVIWTGEYNKINGVDKKAYMWIGYIGTSTGGSGEVKYYGQLEIDPMPCVIGKLIKKSQEDTEAPATSGIFLNIFLADHEPKNKNVKHNPEDDDLPY